MNTKELIKEKIDKKLNEIVEMTQDYDEMCFINTTISEIKELLEIIESLNE